MKINNSRTRGSFQKIAEQLAGYVPASIGWAPDQYWNATPAELASIFTALAEVSPTDSATRPLDQTQLEKMKEEYPDASDIR